MSEEAKKRGQALEAEGDADGAAHEYLAAGLPDEAARVFSLAFRPLDAAVALLTGIAMIGPDLDDRERARAQLAAGLLREGGREDHAKLVQGALAGSGPAFPSAVLKSVLAAPPEAAPRPSVRPAAAPSGDARRSGSFVHSAGAGAVSEERVTRAPAARGSAPGTASPFTRPASATRPPPSGASAPGTSSPFTRPASPTEPPRPGGARTEPPPRPSIAPPSEPAPREAMPREPMPREPMPREPMPASRSSMVSAPSPYARPSASAPTQPPPPSTPPTQPPPTQPPAPTQRPPAPTQPPPSSAARTSPPPAAAPTERAASSSSAPPRPSSASPSSAPPEASGSQPGAAKPTVGKASAAGGTTDPGGHHRAEAGWRAAGDAAVEETIKQFLATGRKGAAARVAWEANQFERALEWFIELGLKYQAGSCLRSLGRDAEALAMLLEVPLDDSRYRRACSEIVALAKTTGRLDFEVDRFLTAYVGEGPRDADECDGFLELGELYAHAGFAVGARRCAEGVLRHRPDDARAKALVPSARPKSGPPVGHAADLSSLPSIDEFRRLAKKHAPSRPAPRRA